MGSKLAELIVKAVELLLATLVLILGRCGAKAAVPDAYSDFVSGPYYVPFGDPTSVDANVFGDVIAYGYFWIILAQTICVIGGEKPYLLHFLFDLVGGVGYIAIGSMHIAYWGGNHDDLVGLGQLDEGVFMGTGAMAIFTGLALLGSAVLYAMKLFSKGRDD